MKKLSSFVILFASAFLLSACGGDSGPSSEPSKPNTTPSQPSQTNQGKIEIAATEDTKPIISQNGGSVTVKFNATGSWTASSSDTWCSLSTASGQAGSNNITINVSENETFDDRTATVTLKSGTNSQTITVSQVQKDAIVLAMQEQYIEYNTPTLDFDIQTNVEIQVSISDDAKSWIKQVNTRALQSVSLHFDIEKNEGNEGRSGVITIKGGDITQTVVVNQGFDYLAIERAALMDLYNSTDGDNWKRNDNWGSDKPVGEWYGVTTSNEGHIIFLDLYFNNLKGVIPESIGTLVDLKNLSLLFNEITGTIPESIGNLINLEALNLGYNQITGTIPETIGNLLNLEFLSLTGNQLTGDIPECIGNLVNLKELYLSSNQLSGTIPNSFINLVNLESIEFSENRMDGTLSEIITDSDWWKRCGPRIIQQEGYMLKYSSLYESTDYSDDGKILTLQMHTIGKGIPLVILGEAFSDRMIADGTYNKMATQTMDAFFEVEPFNTFRNYFDVYAVVAVSPNEIPGEKTVYNVNIDRFIPDVGWSKIEEDILSIPSLNGSLDNVTCLLLLNGKKYSDSWKTFYASTYNVGECSYFLDDGSYTIGNFLVHHEGGGHAFGLLTDEMVYDDASEVFPESSYSNIDNNHSQGWEYNIDYHSTKETSFWKDFFANPDYEVEKLDLYEGAVYSFAKGIYRPSYRSIMYAGENTDYYNAPSRLAIYKRIMELSGEGYSFEKFLEYDKKNLEAIKNGAITRNYVERHNDDISIKSPCVITIK